MGFAILRLALLAICRSSATPHTVWIKNLGKGKSKLQANAYFIRLLVQTHGKKPFDLGVTDGQIIKNDREWIEMYDDFWTYPGTPTHGGGQSEKTNLTFELYTRDDLNERSSGESTAGKKFSEEYKYHFLTSFKISSLAGERKIVSMGYELKVEITTGKNAITRCKPWEKKTDQDNKDNNPKERFKFALNVEVGDLVNIRRVRWDYTSENGGYGFHHYHEIITRMGESRCLVEVGLFGIDLGPGVAWSTATYRSPDPLVGRRKAQINKKGIRALNEDTADNFSVEVADRRVGGGVGWGAPKPFRLSWHPEDGKEDKPLSPHHQAVHRFRELTKEGAKEIIEMLDPNSSKNVNLGKNDAAEPVVSDERPGREGKVEGVFPQDFKFCILSTIAPQPKILSNCMNCSTITQRNLSRLTTANGKDCQYGNVKCEWTHQKSKVECKWIIPVEPRNTSLPLEAKLRGICVPEENKAEFKSRPLTV